LAEEGEVIMHQKFDCAIIVQLLCNSGGRKELLILKEEKSNRSYQELNDVGKKTAYLELSGLIEKGLLLSTGKGGSVRYVPRF